jgi:hypothetical protein
MIKRSLYQCSNAKVKGDKIYCKAGKVLVGITKGDVNIKRLIRGEPLELTVCQKCDDYDELGAPITPEERGWIQIATLKESHVKNNDTTKARPDAQRG